MKLALEKVKGNFILENTGNVPFDYNKNSRLHPGDKAILCSSKDVLKAIDTSIKCNGTNN